MFVGLVILRRHGCGRVGLTHLLWKQAVIWLLLGFVSEAPQAVMAVFSSNEQFIEMIVTPGTITMIIAATRMHRSLVDLASGPPGEVTLETLELGGAAALSTFKPAQAHAAASKTFNQQQHGHPTDLLDDHGCGSSNSEMSRCVNSRILKPTAPLYSMKYNRSHSIRLSRPCLGSGTP
ncbi:hypothetical protein BJV77DRAFT_140383 [Russula vinacea]|nr:hypothetical protein BJV77DRAFT_140383 [Russula vinacea]